MNRAEFFWTLQKVSQEKRNGFLLINSSSVICTDGKLMFMPSSLTQQLLNAEDFEIGFERNAHASLEQIDDFISPGHLMLDLVESGFNISTFEEVLHVEQTQSLDLIEKDSPNESVDKALLEAMQERELGSEISGDFGAEKDPDLLDTQISFLGSAIAPLAANHKESGLSAHMKSFNYTCLVPEVSRGLVTIIGFGFIAFSAFIVPRLFSGLFEAIASVVMLP